MRVLVLFEMIFCVFFLSNCRYQEKSKLDKIRDVTQLLLKDTNIKYDSLKKTLDINFISHFPSKIDTNNISMSGSISNTSNIISLEVTNRIKFDECVSLVKKYENIKLVKYKANDTCLLIPNRHITRKNATDDQARISTKNQFECCKFKTPVPNFWMNTYVVEEEGINLSEDFVIYVLDAKPGIFTDKNHTGVCKDMPEKWENGFSKGVAISEERSVIIYWVIIW